MDVRQLKYFVSVCQTASPSETARVFSVSRQAVYESLKRLESELGIKLLQNDKNRVCPTDAGKAILENATNLVQLIDNAPHYMNINSPSHIVLGMDMVTIGPNTAPHRLINAYGNVDGGCDVVVYQERYEEMIALLNDQVVDLCLIRTARVDFPKCITRILRRGMINLRMGEDNARAHVESYDVAELCEFHFLSHNGESDRFESTHIQDLWDGQGLEVVSHIDSPELFDDALKYRDLAAFGYSWGDDVQTPGIKTLPLVGVDAKNLAVFDAFVYMADSPKRKQIEHFIDFLTEGDRWRQIGLHDS